MVGPRKWQGCRAGFGRCRDEFREAAMIDLQGRKGGVIGKDRMRQGGKGKCSNETQSCNDAEDGSQGWDVWLTHDWIEKWGQDTTKKRLEGRLPVHVGSGCPYHPCRMGLGSIAMRPASAGVGLPNELLQKGPHRQNHDRTIDQEKVEKVDNDNRKGLEVGHRISEGIAQQFHPYQRKDEDPDEHGEDRGQVQPIGTKRAIAGNDPVHIDAGCCECENGEHVPDPEGEGFHDSGSYRTHAFDGENGEQQVFNNQHQCDDDKPFQTDNST